jgi:hypothetical protein
MLGPLSFRARPIAAAIAVLAAAAALLVAPGVARALTGDVAVPGNPTLVTAMNKPPAGYTLTASKVLRIARADRRVQAYLRRHPKALPYEYVKSEGTWQVSWFSRGRKPKELLQVYVDDRTATVTQVWSGFQVAWSMARGYAGAFGRRVNAVYLWLPLCVLFVAPFFPWRRKPSLLHLDLLMLVGFSISLAFFNHAEIGLSVPLVYPFLIYLLARMLLVAFGKGVPRRALRLNISTNWLLCGAMFLMGLRIGLNVLNSNVIDVGYAGVIGADKLIHGHLLYGLWPKDNAFGDTYGPVNYFAYVPFRLIFGWSGHWDSLPAAHAAAIVFDLLTAAELYLLGRRMRGHALGVVFTYAWAAYPFTLWVLSSNTNDSLVSALLVLALLVIGSAPARGVVAALAGLTKFAPFALAPLLLRGIGDRPRERSVAVYIVAFTLTVLAAMLPVLLNGDLSFFWHDSVAYQASRVAPFSVWGLWGGLGLVQHLLQGGAVALAIVVTVLPARRGLVEVAALGAAVLIALQLTVNYWLYAYIVWFFPLVVVAIFASHPRRLSVYDVEAERGSERDRARAGAPEPIPA